jgi:hypothetical protein
MQSPLSSKNPLSTEKTKDKFYKKSLLKQSQNQTSKFYCVGCNRERRQVTPAKVGSPEFFAQILVTTAFFSMLTWPLMHWKGIFAFLIPVGLGFEVFYRMKVRGALVCPDCQFDPILYLSDRPKALRQVEEAWRLKFAEKNLPFPERRKTSRNPKVASSSEDLTSI